MVSTGIWGKESKTESNIPSVIMTLSKYVSVTCLWTHLYMNTSSYISTHQYPFLWKKYKKPFLKSPSSKQKAQNGNKLPSPSMNYAKCLFKMAECFTSIFLLSSSVAKRDNCGSVPLAENGTNI